MTTIYKGFTISTNRIDEMDRLKKTVDDFEKDRNQTHMEVDAARVARSCMGACNLLKPMTCDQVRYLKEIARGTYVGSMVPALAPNRIEFKHFTRSSRVRNLVHGGITGLLAVRLMNDSSQVERTSRTFKSLCVIQRANNEAGCSHVKWSIPEFQMRHNIGAKCFKPRHALNPFESLDHEDALVQFNLLNTAESRAKFMEECNAVANEPNQSRIKYAQAGASAIIYTDAECAYADADNNGLSYRRHHATVLNDVWIAHFMCGFVKVCSTKMDHVNDIELDKLGRSRKLIELLHFMTQVEWMFADLKFVLNMARLYEAFIKRLFYFAKEGVEHSAYMLGRYAPELMTPELHMCVVPTRDLYRVPEMQIADDDALFGQMKAKCEAFMPAAAAPVRQRRYSDEYSDDDYTTTGMMRMRMRMWMRMRMITLNDDSSDDNAQG